MSQSVGVVDVSDSACFSVLRNDSLKKYENRNNFVLLHIVFRALAPWSQAYTVGPRESSSDGHFEWWHIDLQQLEYGLCRCNVVIYFGVCLHWNVFCRHALMRGLVAFPTFSWPCASNAWIGLDIFEVVLAPVPVVELLPAFTVRCFEHHCQ